MFAEVAVPRPVHGTFTYQIPDALAGRLLPGMRVVVPFGRRSLRGCVVALHPTNPHPELTLKSVRSVSDESPVRPAAMIRLATWMAQYYLAPIGEVLRLFFPPVSAAATQKKVRLAAAGAAALEVPGKLEESDRAALAPLAAGQTLWLRQWKAQHHVEARQVRRLVGRRWVEIVVEQSGDESHGRKVQAVGRSAAPLPDKLTAAQRRLLELVDAGPVPVSTLEKDAGISRAVVAGLLRRGLLEPVVERTMRKPAEPALAAVLGPVEPLELTPLQATAFVEVMNWVDRRQHRTLLLHGVTGSGKTEIYLQAVSRTLEQGRTALVLLPEIALTPRALELFRARFGQHVAILHSALSFGERNDEWWRIRKGQASVVIGTRSAVFAPLENLGLIVVDEEHDTSYKQEDTPMYNGRDTAIFRGHLDGAAVVLSSATPALETYFQAVEKKKFEYVSLPERVQNRPLPTVHVIDMREEFNKFGKAAIISEFLRDQIAVRLGRRQQVIVLLNRRGYYAFLLCRSCGLTVLCHQCSITLTYHRAQNRLICHYCGYQRSVPSQCENCRGEYIYYLGEGTEKIEEILGKLFPAAKLARLDRDTTRRKGSFEKILGKFAAGQIDVLVGTQMLAKGHDYPNVTLVGVLSADLGLRMPDFRAAERTFQLLTQVAGRAGRGELPGEVVIQTYYPNHYSLRYACVHDYPEFYAHEIEFRRNFFYPPFSALANLVVQHTDPARARKLALQVGRSLTAGRDRLGTPAALRVIGPARAAIEKIKGRHRYQIIVKSSDRALLHSVLQEALRQLDHSRFPHRHLRIDVDPVTLL